MKLQARKQIIGENLLYGMIWALVYLIPIMNAKLMSEEHVNFSNVFIAWIKVSPYLGLFLLNNYVLARLFLINKRHILWYSLSSLCLLLASFTLVDLYEKTLVNIDSTLPLASPSLTDLEWYWNLLLGSFMFLANDGIKLLYKEMQDEFDLERIKNESTQAQMANLRYQINPHFFMNTLNNIHALIDFDPESAKKGIIELSAMLRYVVYDTSSQSISLDKEIEFINNYIELMKVRFSSDVDIKFNYPQHNTSKRQIPSLILIVFVENAFKHGVSYHKDSFIHIDIEADEHYVSAVIKNSINDSENKKIDSYKGIGMDNVRKRLNLIYEDKYSFESKINEDCYIVKIKIPCL